MRLHPSLGRFVLPVAVTGLALGALAGPARAETAPAVPVVGVNVPEQVTVIEGHTKSVRAEVFNPGKVEAKGVYLKFGSAAWPVDPSVGLGLPAGCDQQGCLVGDLAPGAHRTYTVTLKPGGQTATNLKSTFDVSVGGAAGVLGFDSEVTVVRAKGGVDLELGQIDDMRLGRGQAANVPVVVRNTGSTDVAGMALIFIGEPGLEALTKYRNCEVDNEGLAAAICFVDQKLPAGDTFTLPDATPLQVRLASDAGGPYTYAAAIGAVGLNDDVAAALAAKAGEASGPTMKLKAAPAADTGEDINPDDNVVTFGVIAEKSAADSAGVGGSFAGAVGDVKTVKVGVRDLGPTGVIPSSPAWFQTVKVTIPAGVALTHVDDFCTPGSSAGDFEPELAGQVKGRDYTCFVLDRLGAGATALFSFTGKITEGDHAAGTVVVDGGVQDAVKADDTAALTVRLTASGAGGGLPITGAPAGWVALGGALLLVAGGAAVAVARRRRIVTVID